MCIYRRNVYSRSLNLCVYIYIYIYRRKVYTRSFYLYVCIYRGQVYLRTYTCMYVCKYVYVYMYIYMCVYIYMYVCVYIYIFIGEIYFSRSLYLGKVQGNTVIIMVVTWESIVKGVRAYKFYFFSLLFEYGWCFTYFFSSFLFIYFFSWALFILEQVVPIVYSLFVFSFFVLFSLLERCFNVRRITWLFDYYYYYYFFLTYSK